MPPRKPFPTGPPPLPCGLLNERILGDNLEVLRHLPPDSVDLIYLDPPFFSNRTYEVIWGDAGERRSFEDRWSGGIRQSGQNVAKQQSRGRRASYPEGGCIA